MKAEKLNGFYELSYIVTFFVGLLYSLVFILFFKHGIKALLIAPEGAHSLMLFFKSVLYFIKVQMLVVPLALITSFYLFWSRPLRRVKILSTIFRIIVSIPFLILGLVVFVIATSLNIYPLFWVIFFISLPHLVRGWLDIYDQIPKIYWKAGQSLGLNPFGIFQKIILPNCWHSLLSHLFLVMAVSLGACAPVAYLAHVSVFSEGEISWLPMVLLENVARGKGYSALVWSLFLVISGVIFFASFLNRSEVVGLRRHLKLEGEKMGEEHG